MWLHAIVLISGLLAVQSILTIILLFATSRSALSWNVPEVKLNIILASGRQTARS